MATAALSRDDGEEEPPLPPWLEAHSEGTYISVRARAEQEQLMEQTLVALQRWRQEEWMSAERISTEHISTERISTEHISTERISTARVEHISTLTMKTEVRWRHSLDAGVPLMSTDDGRPALRYEAEPEPPPEPPPAPGVRWVLRGAPALRDEPACAPRFEWVPGGFDCRARTPQALINMFRKYETRDKDGEALGGPRKTKRRNWGGKGREYHPSLNADRHEIGGRSTSHDHAGAAGASTHGHTYPSTHMRGGSWPVQGTTRSDDAWWHGMRTLEAVTGPECLNGASTGL
ncbi:hypothetical protein AB1Y20_016364 [Prymnesium parvum]|uniref:Uncharacterized protein n=1 Tax=Prymnesium parvum TaxID=97485 RepID=A0AB34IEY9_PRYPA